VYSAGSVGGRAFVGKALAKIPWVKTRPWVQNWQRLPEVSESRGFPPVYEKVGPVDQPPQVPLDQSAAGYYLPSYTMKPTLMTNIPMAAGPAGPMTAISPTVVGTLPMIPQMNGQIMMNLLDTNMAAMSANPGQAMTVSPTSTMLQRSNTVNTMNTMVMAPNMQMQPPIGHQPNASVSSVAAQYGGTLAGNFGGTVPPYYNQSELARQPSDAYDPARRQVNRISELSSLSSGFGDGDIIMPGTYAQDDHGHLLPRPPPPATQALRSSQNFVGRLQVSPSAAASSPRDTVYTEHSEDSPPRFRTVNSWVNQQAGRIRRAQQRVMGKKEDDSGDEGEVPPVPGLPAGHGVNGMPPEPQLNMMMPDGEIPRRVDMM
jgi:hypothetical protein